MTSILHYSLGLSPYRTGGLTKYSEDLVDSLNSTKKSSVRMILLYPGQINFLRKKVKIRLDKKAKKDYQVFELVNPMYVPLIYGIKDISSFSINKGYNTYYEFLKTTNTKIVHLHTLQGLHYDFFLAAKKLDIKILYTTHDYFGIWPEPNILSNFSYDELNYSNYYFLSFTNELSNLKLHLMQSSLYKTLKDSFFVKKIRTKLKEENLSDIHDFEENGFQRLKVKYDSLRNTYSKYFECIDVFLFNSSISKAVFQHYFKIEKSQIINVYNSDVKDLRKLNNRMETKHNNKLKLLFIGNSLPYKGYPYLFELFEKYPDLENKVVVSIYGFSSPNINSFSSYPQYSYSKINDVYMNHDLLIIPSLWYETFGFGTLEALSRGVPVILSNNVGSKDLIQNSITGYIYKDMKELYDILIKLYYDQDLLIKARENINFIDSSCFDYDIHVNRIWSIYVNTKKK